MTLFDDPVEDSYVEIDELKEEIIRLKTENERLRAIEQAAKDYKPWLDKAELTHTELDNAFFGDVWWHKCWHILDDVLHGKGPNK